MVGNQRGAKPVGESATAPCGREGKPNDTITDTELRMSEKTWWVRGKGFAEPPQSIIARGGEIVYRVGGGPTSLTVGKFFMPLKVDRVS